MKPIALLGGKGMLGTDLAEVLTRSGAAFDVYDLPEFDISKQEHLESVASRHPLIVNCAAYTNVEKAESEADLANQINGHSVGLLGHHAKKTGSHIIHISTDFVFDGIAERPYVETDAANPLSAYGKSKLLGEELLQDSGCRHCIIRVEWTYGAGGTNFIKKLIELARQRTSLKVVDDQVGSPTATLEAAKVIATLLKDLPDGIFHFAASGYISRFEMARFFFDKLKIEVGVEPCKTTDFPSAAKRPLNSRFDCRKIQSLLPEKIKPWQEPLVDFLEQL